ncbi:neutral zinc metallopeptidase [uncultured Friedmanniella sp.]|uniref:neutral zinc metallopeptidase n=1 Tax=uncultured Friedmanniella sp. TaxID=335381 RepID=UPI0035CCA2CE
MSQQPWGNQTGAPSPWGQQPPQGNPYGQSGFSGWNQPPAPQGYQQPYGYGAPQPGMTPYGRPPQRRRSPLGRLLLAAVGIGLVLLAGTVVAGLASSGSSSSSGGAYQNDDYQVPPPDANPPALPQPETYAEAEAMLTKNTFYSQTAPVPVRCEQDQLNVDTASDAKLKSHFEDLMACLLRVWEPPVTGAGDQIVRPTVTIYSDEITTRCGKSGINAFYCGADQQVYYSNKLDDAVPIVATEKWAADVVMAHEFGHALQARTGILISEAALSQQSDDEQTQLDYSRRLETQADCLSGMFIRSTSKSLGIEQSDVDGILSVYNAVGDDTLSGKANIEGNHGLGRNRQYWGNTGLGTSAVSSCNTFTAKASLVR